MIFIISLYDLYQLIPYFVTAMDMTHLPAIDTLREIVENSVDAIVIINQRGKIVYVNQATVFMFLYKKEDMIGQNVKMLMPEPDKGRHDGYMANYLRTKQKRIIGIGREVIAQKKDGTLFPILLALNEVQRDGELFFSGILHDVTALKEAQEELLELNKSLENRVQERTEKLSEVVNRLLKTNDDLTHEISKRKKAEKALKQREDELRISLEKEKELSVLKSRFVTMASHEFRTPLSTVLSSTNLIEKYATLNKTDKIEQHVAKIKKSVNHLTGILNDFLSLGKWEEGKVTVELSSFSAEAMVEDLTQHLQGVLKEGQDFKIDIEESEIHSDEKLLKNSMINLVSNASKYSPEHSEIAIMGRKTDEWYELAVVDNGRGIPIGEQENMFERFFRASNVTNIEGTGIGLNLVKSYITRLGGEINFESEEGKGTTFTIKIPIKG